MNAGTRKRILFVQQVLQPPGGASAVAAWMLQALKDTYDVTVLAERRADLDGLNRFYGTSLRDTDFSALYPNRLIRGLLRLDPDRGSIQPAAWLMRMCRRYRDSFDVVMGAGMEEMDLGDSGLIYVHYPHLARFWNRYEDINSGLWGLVRGKTRPWIVLAGYSIERMKQNTLLTNSEWTRRRIAESYGISARVIYPPVTASSHQLPWEARENSFVATGRLHPGKRMDWMIRMLAEVRRSHPDVQIHLVGTRDEGQPAERHYRLLRQLAGENRDWVRLHEDMDREELLRLLGRCRYGIHALREEHFGIAPAEALMAGCIPFVHDSGGQVEIVGGAPRLCYTDDEAVSKITAVLNSAEVQADVRESLAALRQRFTVDRFTREIRSAVADYLSRSSAPLPQRSLR